MVFGVGRLLSLMAFCWLAMAMNANALEATEKTISEKLEAYDLSVAYPQFGVETIDKDLAAFVTAEVEDFKSILADREPTDPPYSAEIVYTIMRNDDEMLEVLFTYSYYTGGAHPNSNRFSFNYFLPDGVRFYLPELFTRDGLKTVSTLAIEDLTRTNAGEGDVSLFQAGAGAYEENFHAFNLAENEIVIYFDPYQVMAYAAGPQEAYIPLEKVRDVMRADPRKPLPSFDCGKATTVFEKAICSNAALARLDREVTDAYALKLLWTQPEDQAAIKQQQRDFLKSRDATCSLNTPGGLDECLIEQYQRRLDELRQQP